jgi:hypothetical protein
LQLALAPAFLDCPRRQSLDLSICDSRLRSAALAELLVVPLPQLPVEAEQRDQVQRGSASLLGPPQVLDEIGRRCELLEKLDLALWERPSFERGPRRRAPAQRVECPRAAGRRRERCNPRDGRLERVLRRWSAPAMPVQVVYPSTRHLSPNVNSFVDHLQERRTPPPWELGPTESRLSGMNGAVGRSS